jgi:cytochrome c biogenesis factor
MSTTTQDLQPTQPTLQPAPTTQTQVQQGPPISVGYIFIPAGIIILVILTVLVIRVVPWISWRLKKPSVSVADGVEIAYPLSPVLKGNSDTLKSQKSETSHQDTQSIRSRLSSMFLSSSLLSLNQPRDFAPARTFKSSEFMIVQLDPLHTRVHCSLDTADHSSHLQSDAVVTVGVPPSYPSDSMLDALDLDHDEASVDTA